MFFSFFFFTSNERLNIHCEADRIRQSEKKCLLLISILHIKIYKRSKYRLYQHFNVT